MKQNFFTKILGWLFGSRDTNHVSVICCDTTESSRLKNASEGLLTSGNNDGSVELESLASSQIVGINGGASFDREVGHVILSKTDHLKGDSSVSATYKVTPLHVFKNEPGAGDYYVVDATYTIKNDGMYQAPHTNMHGGVHVRIGGFCLESINIKSELKSKFEPTMKFTKLFAQSPLPETDNIEHNYTINSGWSIGGGLTVGVKGGKNCYAKGSGIEGSANANFDFSVSHSKSESYSMNDLNIHNQSNDCIAQFNLINRNVTHFDWGCDNGISDCADFAKSSLIFHAYWIWYIPNTNDEDIDLGMYIKTTITPRYRSCRFYSTKADYDEFIDNYTFSDTCDLLTPNRTKNSIVEIYNDTEYPISNIMFNKISDKEDGNVGYEPCYGSHSSFAQKQTGKFCLESGKYSVTMRNGNGKMIEVGPKNPIILEDGNNIHLVVSSDFEEYGIYGR